ncbi:sensor histidine kinase [Schwartzia sp. (in: firmicutes)]
MPELENLPEEALLDDIGEKSLRRILESMVSTIEGSKSQIFDVYEAAHSEVESSKKNLQDAKRLTQEVIDEVDALEEQEQKEKQKLVLVSSSFSDYSEEKIQEAYESVKNVQVQLGIAREKERQLRRQRNQLELRLYHLQKTVESAQKLAMRISSMLSYLGTQISDVVIQLEAASKNKYLSAAIIRAQEDERLRVSREIHDGPAQDVANLLLESSIIERLIDVDPDEAKMSIKELRKHLKGCLTDIRQIIFDMRPMSLDDLGLVAAIGAVARKFRDRDMLNVRFSVDGEEVQLPDHVKTGLFRIVQESLNNVLHHSGVKEANLRMLYTDAAVSILVEDKGQGFDVDEFEMENQNATEDKHFGILGMRERATIIGAELSVTSRIGEGTRVHIRYPLKAEHPIGAEEEKETQA